ncbi:NAD(P)H-dependent glycerol-3-phosphate dehydrogenase [Methylocella sp. CPCC 101449]|jgi:glycerol-3-phosphate dehydrogenase (NAD(P)+)|uniref:NAD(P)H-dependent glycerol-3-phosphate dehydrogenase n=1 Tax=Methylocella sp. CPCC 101449 TaxID=2987531 RepID=UPI00288EBFDB|nr:NAD(P)H-dependent glycerol-3-phosphate dehydrogenase [Methylocella sp. CPCC 101449]MDT2020974.1 NAD(P)-dependent glycerol-3-phosphate dehydrogenase [Methylocella sp. CPCC 101449]HEV2570769.1 NAD(P)H-dependent glycerol-3-phosphate dehydrogenase [Beijerinckiaceae bacterium]
MNENRQPRGFTRVGVIGAGAWGTALANVAARAGHPVDLWGRDTKQIEALCKERVNTQHLPDIRLEQAVAPTHDMHTIHQADLVLAVVPTQSLRNVLRVFAPMLKNTAPLVICAKGIEIGSGLFVSEIARKIIPQQPVAVLSGPSFAHDVARGLPTAVTIAATDGRLAERIGAALATPTFRLYHTDDLRGVEIGGAAKNVLAIACGIAAGRGLGASAGAALVARGFAELSRFGRAFGARSETLMGLSGLGDLVLTCGSTQSRNFALGVALGKGATLADARAGKLAEGAFTASGILELAQRQQIDMPIAQAVDAVLSGKLSIDGAVDALMARPLRGEAS